MSVNAERRLRLGSLACVIAMLAGGCAQESGAVDVARVADSVDVGPLRGRAVPKTACSFARNLADGSAGSGVARVWLECPPLTASYGVVGFVEVASMLTGEEPAEDSIRCEGDPRLPRLQSCTVRHGMITIHTRATCAPDRCDPEQDARELMARVVELLATQPEQPCRLCPRHFSPQRVAELTSTFSGTGPKRLGTIEVQVDSRIRYVALERGIRIASARPPRVMIEDARQQGQADVARGTYREVAVSASGDWSFLIEPR